MSATLTIDIGGTKCAVAVTDEHGVSHLTTWPTQGSTENLAKVRQFVDQTVEPNGIAIDSVGVCFGGPVDAKTTRVKRSVHVAGWENFDFREWAASEFQLPVAVDNDANIGALAELRHGAHHTNNLLYVTISTGIGAGVISNGEILRGHTNDAGELGHIRISDEAKKCSCGRTGCLERMCSGYWLEIDYGKPAADLLSNADFLTEYCTLLTRGLANAILLYNPEVIVLGGGVSRVGQPLVDQLNKQLDVELASWRGLKPRIAISQFDSSGVHLGVRELTRDLFR